VAVVPAVAIVAVLVSALSVVAAVVVPTLTVVASVVVMIVVCAALVVPSVVVSVVTEAHVFAQWLPIANLQELLWECQSVRKYASLSFVILDCKFAQKVHAGSQRHF